MAVNSQVLLPTRPQPPGPRAVHACDPGHTAVGTLAEGGRVVYKANVFRWPPSCSSCPPQPGYPGLLRPPPARGVRGAVRAVVTERAFPWQQTLRGFSQTCPSLGWSKTSHPSETPEDNGRLVQHRGARQLLGRGEEGAEWAGLVTWVLTWPTTPRCTLRFGALGLWEVFQVPCLPSVSSHQLAQGAHACPSALQGALLSLRVSHLHPTCKRIALFQSDLPSKVLL